MRGDKTRGVDNNLNGIAGGYGASKPLRFQTLKPRTLLVSPRRLSASFVSHGCLRGSLAGFRCTGFARVYT